MAVGAPTATINRISPNSFITTCEHKFAELPSLAKSGPYLKRLASSAKCDEKFQTFLFARTI
jgi:hypothetical protein